MKLFAKVAIVGLGLIGGSIALGIKQKKLAGKIIGVSRRKRTLLLAKKYKAVDIAAQDLEVIRDADLVILATPIDIIIKLSKKISKIVRKDCIVTDVGSTKKKISGHLSKIFPNYIGSHPLAGSEKAGITHASPEIFKHSLCILTPGKNTKAVIVRKIKRLWKELGAKTVSLSPQEHDKIISFTSHLAHIVAFALTGTIPKKYLGLGASGLKDTTRIAASDSKLWTGILLTNQDNLAKAINLFERQLRMIKEAIKGGNAKELGLLLQQAQEKRKALK